MSKNILIYSDGTGQIGGLKPDQRLSNIYKLYRATRVSPENNIDPREQVAFYDAGLGTDDGSGGFLNFLGLFRKLLGSITGRGITKNITDCYEAILNNYEPGDRIFLFGFSRGAYTARCVANVITLVGIPTVNKNGKYIRKYSSEVRSIADEAVRKVYEHGAGFPRAKYEDQRNEKALRFREKYKCDADEESNVVPYFVGVFDSVAALGAIGVLKAGLILLFITIILTFMVALSVLLMWALGWSFQTLMIITGILVIIFIGVGWFKSSFKIIRSYPKKWKCDIHFAKWKVANYDEGLSDRIRYSRHAISIDETRANFPRVKWGFKKADYSRPKGEPFGLVQMWFPGNHSDIGGSYPESESRLSDISLQWMIEQTQLIPNPLIIDQSKLHLFPSADGIQHCEVQSLRDRYPKWWPKKLKLSWKEKIRKDARGAVHHPSVVERFTLTHVIQSGNILPYRPKSLVQDEKYKEYYD